MGEQGLAGLAGVARVVERVVDELKADAHSLAEQAERVAFGVARPGDDRAGACRPAKERRGLVLEDAKVDRLARVELGAAAELDDLAVDEATQRVDELAEGPCVGGERAIEGVCQGAVAREDADRVAPKGARRRLAAARGAVADDVVV